MDNTIQGGLQIMPARFAPILFGFVLSASMSFIVSGMATLRNVGLIDGFFSLRIGAWLPSWLVAFPFVLVVAPITRRLVAGLVRVDTRMAS
jgi:hypothetical protein